jgi:hypothetical protein
MLLRSKIQYEFNVTYLSKDVTSTAPYSRIGEIFTKYPQKCVCVCVAIGNPKKLLYLSLVLNWDVILKPVIFYTPHNKCYFSMILQRASVHYTMYIRSRNSNYM